MLITILAIFACCFLLERVVPGWKLPHVRTWPLRVLLINGVQLCVILFAGVTWERWLSSWSVFHLSQHVSPAVGGLLAYLIATLLGEFFYHTNVKTPRWVGFFFQRPEMHRIHHQHNRHKNNYGDITWWDMLFGTYENPPEFKATCGFDDEKEQRLFSMLAFNDVHKTLPSN